MLFEVTLSDGTTRTMQAHSKKQLAAALQGVTITSAVKRSACKSCRAVATVQGTLCADCYAQAVAQFKEECPDAEVEGKELECLLISFFVGG